MHFYLLSTVILTTREGFRRALMRDSVEESSLGYAWLVLPVGGFLSIAVPFAVVWSQNISTSTPYGQALLYYGVAAFIELCAEPHYIRAMRMSAFKLRLSAETTSTVLRSFLTYALVSYNQDVVLAFAYSQVRIIKLLPPRDSRPAPGRLTMISPHSWRTQYRWRSFISTQLRTRVNARQGKTKRQLN